MKKRVLFFAVVAMFAALGWAKPELVVQEGIATNVADGNFLKFSSDGKYILSSTNEAAQIWESESGFLIKSLKQLKDTQAAFSDSGNYCAYISRDKQPVLYNCQTGKTTVIDASIKTAFTPSVAFSPNERHIAFFSDGTLFVYDLKTLAFEKKFSVDAANAKINFSKDSSKVFVCSSKLFVYSLDRGLIGSFSIASDAQMYYVSPDGSRLAEFCGKSGAYELNVYELGLNRKRKLNGIKFAARSNDVCFSADSKKIISAGSTGCFVYDADTNTRTDLIVDSHYSIGMLVAVAVSPDEKKLVVESDYRKVYQFSLFDYKAVEEKSIICGVSEIRSANYFLDGKKLAIETGGYGFSLFDQGCGSVAIPDSLRRSDAICSKGLIDVEKENGCLSVFFYEFPDYKKKKLVDLDSSKLSTTSYFADNSSSEIFALYNYSGNDKEIFFYNLKKSQTPKVFFAKDKNTRRVAISPNGVFVVLECSDYSTIVNTDSGKTIKLDYKYLSFSRDGSYCGAYNNKKYSFDMLDTRTWKLVKTIDRQYSGCFSESGSLVLGEQLYKNAVIDFYSGRTVCEIPRDMGEPISFLFNDSVCLFLGRNRSLNYCSAKTGKHLASLIADSNGDWLVYTPEGYFNGSEGGIQKFVHLVDGMKVTGLGQLEETFFRPDLVTAKLRGEDISAQYELESLSDITATGDAPLVRFVNPPASSASRDVNVSFTVQDQGGGIGGVYLTLNGKVIQVAEGSRRIEAVGASQKSVGKTLSFAQPLTLQNGENLIEAYADNAAGKIQSRRASAKITWKGSISKPSLHVLSVGVNKYRDKSLWLQYSVPDAQAVAQAFAGQKTSLYQNVYTYQLLDGDVTKENLLAQFNTISSKVAADDVFVLFVAGHGTAHQKTGDYYFLPANFRYTDSEAIASQGVSKDDILKYMKNIKAGKTLIMLDTCNSGAFTNDKAMRGVAEKTALDRLCHSTGQAILTAASEEQSAMEGYNGHGIFTYVLLEALSGKADRNKDGYITLNELASYIDEQVPELSYQKWGYEQVPMKELRKQDFPLVGK